MDEVLAFKSELLTRLILQVKQKCSHCQPKESLSRAALAFTMPYILKKSRVNHKVSEMINFKMTFYALLNLHAK